ncbi:MAG: tRNA pseudouridine(55) synthase TruB [Dehalococcoidales bacterium]|nr:tRNA pseudouridine(55) synthase TruB [Dehalococcoidales bacterium]
MDGILNLNKPAGMTSFGVVARVRRITGERRAGHAGTLDPLATGVLPVCLGKATRVIPYLFDETKAYRAEVELGKATDTYDITGKVIRMGDASRVQRKDVEEMLARFTGEILQVPPMYSAVKFEGKPLYKLARAGVEVERKKRTARVFKLEITGWQPPVVTLDIDCGKGTYIRCLANDLGEELGCGAVMKSLVRLRVGPFRVEESVTIPELEEAFRSGAGVFHIYPADYVLQLFDAIVVSREQMCSLVHGMPVTLVPVCHGDVSKESPSGCCRAYTQDGMFIGMVRYKNEQWYPDKIICNFCFQQ